MPRRPLLPLLLWGSVSLGLHAAALGAVLRTPGGPPAETPRGTGALVGDTLDLDEALAAAESEAAAVPESESAAVSESVTATATGSVAATEPTTGHRGRKRPAGGGTPAAASPPPALFGAVGVRYATDLATTFTRAFPQAASADALWSAAPDGPAGTADVTLVLDEAGHLRQSDIAGSPSPALRRGLERTLVLLRDRTFTARGATTRLRVRARVSREEVHDGLHGEVFALSGGSFAGEVGSAFFALPSPSGPGRRIDVELRAVP